MDVVENRQVLEERARVGPDEAARAAALRRLSIIDSEFEPEFDALVRVAAHLTGCPVSLISLLDTDRLWFKAAHGLDIREVPRAGSFCEHAACDDESFVVRDALADPRFAENPLVVGWPNIRFYLGKPINFEGQRIGTLCVIDVKPRDPTPDESRCVVDLARVITSMLVSRSLNRQLNERDRLLQQLSKEVPGVIYQFQHNPDGSRFFPYASSAVSRIFECEPEQLRVDAQPAFDRIHPDDLQLVNDSIELSAQSVDTWRAQFRVVLPQHGLRWLEGHSTPERLESGALLWHGYIWDITEQHESGRLLREKEAAEQADRAKSQFLARVSHELRTPLNAILGFAQLLGQDDSIRVHRQWADQLQHIESAGQHLLALINDILDLSRVDTGMAQPVMRRVELPATVERCLAMVEPSARSVHINLLRSGFESRIFVSSDQRRLEQCVVNLLSNAIKYNHTGGTVIVALSADAGEAVVRIRDSGIGLSADQMSRLFQPFNRLGAEQSGVDGTGLGLSITKALIEQMQGRIDVCSTQGVGSEFIIHMPLADAQDERPQQRAAHAGSVGVGDARRPQLQRLAEPPRDVLYVEDNGLNRMLMLAIFAARPHWRLHLAGDPAAANELLERITPDLLMLDLHLPGCSGLELLRDIRSQSHLSSIPAIAVSADALPEDIEKALAAGFIDYWVKPIDTRRAIESLEALFRRPVARADRSAPVEDNASAK